MDDARVLACRQVRPLLETAREQVLTSSATEVGQPISDSASGLLGDFELNWSARFLLDYCRSVANRPARAHVVDFEPNEVAAPELAVNGQIDHREIAFAALQLEPHPDRPDVLRLPGPLLTDQRPLFHGSRRRGRDIGFSMGMVASDADPSTPAPLDLDRLEKLSP
jgi:hypothetical protein